MFLYLGWRDSIKTHRSNKPYNFIVDLPKTLLLEGEWEVALTDIKIKASKRVSFYILTDFCEESIVKGSQRSVLRRVDDKFGIYPLPYYVKVIKSEIQRVRVIVLDQNLDFFELTEINCTLHLRRIQ